MALFIMIRARRTCTGAFALCGAIYAGRAEVKTRPAGEIPRPQPAKAGRAA